MRFAAIIEYDGSGFRGWQLQNGERSVQACVELALSEIANDPVRVTVAGRTDAGVHACAQVLHFDSGATRSDYEWLRGANSKLPRDVALRWVARVNGEFHARFSATGRRYRYIILNRSVRPTYLAGRVSWEYRALDVAPMHEAARCLVGTRDFSSFRSVHCQAKDPVREVRRLDVWREGEFIFIEVEANAFLHHMVRNMAGVLVSVGAGEQPPEWVGAVLSARDRTAGGVTAPADGLYLIGVDYPPRFEIPRLSAPLALW